MSPNSNRDRFMGKLDDLGDDARAEVNRLDMEAVPVSVDWAKNKELMDLVEVDTFGENLVNALEIESVRVFEAMDLDELREENQLLKVTESAMSKAIERMEVVTDSFDGANISNENEVIEFWQRAAVVLQNIDAKALMYESAVEAGMDGDAIQAFYESVEDQIPEDSTAVVEAILEDTMTEADREYVAEQIIKLSARDLSDAYTESTKIIQTGEVALLLQNLNENPKEKANVIEIVAVSPGGPEAILDLTVGGYLTVAEAETLIEDVLATEHDPDRINAYEEVLVFILGDTMQQVSERRSEVQREAVERMPYMIGHKNQAAAKLSYKGIASTYLKLIATSGLIMNVLANWRDPVNGILLNPMIAASLAVGTLGAEMDPSDIGLWPKPGTPIASLSKDRDDAEMAETESMFGAFDKDMLNHPIEAELYYNLADRIETEARDQMTAGVPLREVDIFMDNMGVDYDKLPVRYRSISKEAMEARFTDWVQTFMFDEGLNLDSASDQKDYMDEVRDESPMLYDRWPQRDLTAAL